MQSSGSSGRERAYAYLRERLLGDPDLAGTFINEQQIAEDVGVSRTPVREALLLLSAEDLVRLVPNRGALVPALRADQIHHILAARTAIESWAVEQTLALGSAPVQAMRECLDRQKALLDSGSNTDFIAVDREFHTLLLAATGNPVMSQMYETLRTRHVPIGVAALRRNLSRRDEVIAEHENILAALASGDLEVARDAVRDHLVSTATNLTRG